MKEYLAACPDDSMAPSTGTKSLIDRASPRRQVLLAVDWVLSFLAITALALLLVGAELDEEAFDQLLESPRYLLIVMPVLLGCTVIGGFVTGRRAPGSVDTPRPGAPPSTTGAVARHGSAPVAGCHRDGGGG